MLTADHQAGLAQEPNVPAGGPISEDELSALVRGEQQISRATALRLLRSHDDELQALLLAACALRDEQHPKVITYSRKVFIPLTNLCRDYCGYCAFRRSPGASGAHTMTPDEVLAVAEQGEKLGCTEALFSLGDKPEALFPEMREALRRLGHRSTLEYLEAMCRLVLQYTRLLPHANPGLMSAAWIARLFKVSPSLGLMLESTSSRLSRLRAAHDRAPDKIPFKRLRVIEEAGKQGVPFTTGILVGIGETLADRVESLFAIRELHARYGHVQEVIIQNFRRKPEIHMHDHPEPAEDDFLRTIAVARLVLGGKMNLQAPPNLSVPNFARLLAAGINDWGGVSPLTPDFINPERPWPNLRQLQRETEAAGFRLAQRLPIYPEFIPQVMPRGGLLAERLREAAGPQGLARSAA